MIRSISYICLFATVAIGLELTLEPDELIKAHRESSGGFYFYDSNGATIMFNRSLFVYRESLYDKWSSWSGCSNHTCLQHRYRSCVNESYTEPVNYLVTSARVCPFKYILEERECEDKSNCTINAKPSKELKRMQAICGKKKSMGRDLADSTNKKSRVNKNEGEEEEEYESEKRYYRQKFSSKRRSQKIKSSTSSSWLWHVGICKGANYNSSEGQARCSMENIVCGGTLITPRWVLTAAHCIRRVFGPSVAIPFDIISPLNTSGMHSISVLVPSENIVLESKQKRVENKSDHLVDQLIIHPDWVPRRVNSPFDVALLRLKTPVDIENSNVTVACMPEDVDDIQLEDSDCFSLGWSDDTRSSSVSRLHHFSFFRPFFRPLESRKTRTTSPREIKVTVDPPEKCFHHDDENSAQICASSYDTGVFEGDTGGGLFCRNELNGRWYVHGVMGSGPMQCCKSRRWLYNSVGSVLKWINRYAT